MVEAMESTIRLQSRTLHQLTPERRALLAKLLNKQEKKEMAAASETAGGIRANHEERNEPFPLTRLQQAYWIGRSGVFDLGTYASHSYIELQCRDLDLARLEEAFNRLIERHDMMRAVILEDGRQRILPETPRYAFANQNWIGSEKEKAQEALEALRERLSHNVRPSGEWPLFEVAATHMEENLFHLHVSLDALIFDGWSIYTLFREWKLLYENPTFELPAIEVSFRDYVLELETVPQQPEYEKGKQYWTERIKTLPSAPKLPMHMESSGVQDGRFVRRRRVIEAETWRRVKQIAGDYGITANNALLAVYVEVLSLWSGQKQFCLNVPHFNRQALHPHVTRLIGEFASFTLLEVNNRPDLNFAEKAKRYQEQLWTDLDNALFDGVDVLRELAKQVDTGGSSLMPVVFTASAQDEQRRDAYPTAAAEELGELAFAINQTTQVWLDNHVSEQQGRLVIDWDCVEALFPIGMMDSLVVAFCELIRYLGENKEHWTQRSAEMNAVLIPDAQKCVRRAVNGIPWEIPAERIQDSFLWQAEVHPERIAIRTTSGTLSYGELMALANRWARKIDEVCLEQSKPIAVVMEKGWESIVAALGILISGRAYLPIDPSVPNERLRYLLKNAESSLALTQSRLEGQPNWPESIRLFSLDTEDVSSNSSERADPKAGTDDTAFVIYTSGSTGLPKGVMIAHRGAVNSLQYTQEHFAIGPEDKVLAVTALHHDMSVFDVFGLLGVGGTMVIPDAEDRRDPSHWWDLIKSEGVTVWNSVPAMMEMLLDWVEENGKVLPETLRLVFLGGDWIPLNLPERLRAAASKAKLVSVGGPTETTLWNIWHEVDELDPEWKSVPYGKPIANTAYYLLNDWMEECPDWTTGEMYCAGVGVAQGYLNDEVRTLEKFVAHPRTGERLCRTGDLGRRWPDGTLEFLGRADFQVKIQGQRIELGEIEAALLKHPEIKQAVAVVVGEAQAHKKLAAYYVLRNGKKVEAKVLHEHLSSQLPAHMIPSFWQQLETLPLTANGKVDRRSLPRPEVRTEKKLESTIKANRTENGLLTRIQEIVAAVLGLPQPDVDTNLLALGANSIDMVRIGNELGKALGNRPRIEQIFRLQTIRALAGFYEVKVEASEGERDITVAAQLQPMVELLRSYSVMIEPCKREEFKNSRPGIRRDGEGKTAIPLIAAPMTETQRKKYEARRSHRKFSLKPVSFGQFSEWLGCLRQERIGEKVKFQYGSPGGLNPTQVYIHTKAGRVEGIPAGIYYYHPEEHRLIALTEYDPVDRSIHIPFINQPIFDEAAFSVFFIANLDAIGPSYGERSLHFVTLESGILAHHLEMNAKDLDIGLCQIGSIEFEKIRPHFHLTEKHVLVHSMLGGRVNTLRKEEPTASCSAGDPLDKAVELARKIKELTREEIQQLLKAKGRGSE